MKKNAKPCRCPKCDATENQINHGFNRSGTQRCRCKGCGHTYTLAPKPRAYSEEIRREALNIYESGISGCGVGRIFGFSKANVYNWMKKNDKDV
jgi:transposase-like protein